MLISFWKSIQGCIKSFMSQESRSFTHRMCVLDLHLHLIIFSIQRKSQCECVSYREKLHHLNFDLDLYSYEKCFIQEDEYFFLKE